MVETMTLDTDVEVEEIDKETDEEYWNSNIGKSIIEFALGTPIQDYKLKLKTLENKGYSIGKPISKMTVQQAKNTWINAQSDIKFKAKQYNSGLYHKVLSDKSKSSRGFLRR